MNLDSLLIDCVLCGCIGLLKYYGPDHGDANDCKGLTSLVTLNLY